jgi:hypothetical protein
MWNAQSHPIWQKSRLVAFNLASDTKAGCLVVVKAAQEGGEPKPTALRSELLRNVFLIFWGQKNELSIDR